MELLKVLKYLVLGQLPGLGWPCPVATYMVRLQRCSEICTSAMYFVLLAFNLKHAEKNTSMLKKSAVVMIKSLLVEKQFCYPINDICTLCLHSMVWRMQHAENGACRKYSLREIAACRDALF